MSEALTAFKKKLESGGYTKGMGGIKKALAKFHFEDGEKNRALNLAQKWVDAHGGEPVTEKPAKAPKAPKAKAAAKAPKAAAAPKAKKVAKASKAEKTEAAPVVKGKRGTRKAAPTEGKHEIYDIQAAVQVLSQTQANIANCARFVPNYNPEEDARLQVFANRLAAEKVLNLWGHGTKANGASKHPTTEVAPGLQAQTL